MSAAELPPSDMGGEKEQQQAPQQEVPTTTGRDRLGLIKEIELNPQSLVGSFCHRLEGGSMVWGGAVVAEVQAGKYLIALEACLPGAKVSKAQVIMPIEAMFALDEGNEWRFYDTEDEMRKAYQEHVVSVELEAP